MKYGFKSSFLTDSSSLVKHKQTLTAVIVLKTTFFIDGKDVNDVDDADNNLSNYESNHACVKADIQLLDVYFFEIF